MRVYEKVWLQPQQFHVVEQCAKREDGPEEVTGIKLKGTAIKGDSPTRNGIAYTTESLGRFATGFTEQKKIIPSLDSHHDESIRQYPPFGHVEMLSMNGQDLKYQIDVDPEEKMFIRKVKRGDVREVSIQAIVDQIDEKEDMDGTQYIVANVREILEISPVLIPGSRDSNMQLLEKFGVKDVTKENLHVYEKKYGLAVTEKRLVEKFKSGIYKEAQQPDEDIYGRPPGEVEEEDINSGNSGTLTKKILPGKIKLAPEEIKKGCEALKILTKRVRR